MSSKNNKRLLDEVRDFIMYQKKEKHSCCDDQNQPGREEAGDPIALAI